MRSCPRRATRAICRTIPWRSRASRSTTTERPPEHDSPPPKPADSLDRYADATNVKEFTSLVAPKLLALRNATSIVLVALLGQPAAPAPRSWVGRVRVVGAADVIDALGAWRASGSPDFHRDSIEAAP